MEVSRRATTAEAVSGLPGDEDAPNSHLEELIGFCARSAEWRE